MIVLSDLWIFINEYFFFIFLGLNFEEIKWFSMGVIYGFCICLVGSGLL